jgi:phage shock protein C
MSAPEVQHAERAGSEQPRPRLTRSRGNRIIGGVAGGLGHYFGIDAVIVRLIFVLLAFTGGGILAYIIAWIIIPEAGEGEEETSGTGPAASSMVAGLILVAVGGILLVDRVLPVLSWRYVAPVVLIGVGVVLLVRREGSQ